MPERRDRKLKMKFRRLYCEICDIKFDCKHESVEHNTALHQEPITVCEFCGKYSDPKSHHAHLRTHQEPRYLCEHCSYVTSEKNRFKKHITIHMGLKSYYCEFCAASFYAMYALKEHIRRNHDKHAVIERYPCHLCDKQFHYRFKLYRHLDSHNDLRRHTCPVCNSCFNRRDTWKKHLKLKHSISLPRQRNRKNNKEELDLLNRLINGQKSSNLPAENK